MRQRPASRSFAAPRARRCAVYTRVSTDHGLEQNFNSLDAQREACVAYVRSQVQEGWTLAHGRFDDGGYSGASLDRPALQTLLEAVRQRRIDVIVVYKVDRLTRSLADFAKLVELFDAHGVSFISITQSFNTTTSMGRLTLNMLLSFAQFEREVTGERIRDKIAASKKKGLWVGGVVPLGYKAVERKLRIDEAEAQIVRLIFERYGALGSLIELMRELDERGIVTRTRTLASGRTIGGIPFTKGPLAYLLKNRMYLGEINHGRMSYPGEHPAIIDRALFETTQAILARNAAAKGYSQSRSDALLLGKLFDDRGHRMSPSFAVKRGVRYRYYVSRAVTEGRSDLKASMARVPAADVEAAVLDALRRRGGATDQERWSGPLTERSDLTAGASDPAIRSKSSSSPWSPASPSSLSSPPAPSPPLSPTSNSSSSSTTETVDVKRFVDGAVERVDIRAGSLAIALTRQAAAINDEALLIVPWTKPPVRIRRELLPPTDGAHSDARPTRSDVRSKLLAAIAMARGWLDDLAAGRVLDAADIAARENRSVRSVSMLLSLAFLAPPLVQAIVDNRLPRGVGLTCLTELPSEWSEQFVALGLQPPRYVP